MADPFIGQIDFLPWTFLQVGYGYCNGSLVPVSQNQALYVLIGNKFGGTTNQTFALPDLGARTAVGAGTAPGGSFNWPWAIPYGTDSVILEANQIPAHSHLISQPSGAAGAANQYTPAPAPALLSGVSNPMFFAAPVTSVNTTMHPSTLAPFPNPPQTVFPHENRQPFLALNPCIALEGVFPVTSTPPP